MHDGSWQSPKRDSRDERGEVSDRVLADPDIVPADQGGLGGCGGGS